MRPSIAILILSVTCLGCKTNGDQPAPASGHETVAAAAEGWKARFQEAIDAIAAAEDPWAALCQRIDTLSAAYAEGDPEVQKVLKFEEDWSRLGAKLSNLKTQCEKGNKPVLPAGSTFATTLKTPWERVKAKLP
ncbi:MAG TPA: hypothetical protein PK668_21635 [Myxococcota bacterium]|nr:hypothetical protein [Myxococcota bacterium]HRY96081.1 hypothetical protein [Myxococcota bacterium]HSA22625.1 hypothetical protein [Myxococcota bacterium]